MTSIGGLVLAGGSGRRFGRPKASVTFAGQSLVARAVALLAPYCVETAVATRTEIPIPAVPARVVYDRDEPSALRGLASDLSALATDSVLVLACDLLVQPALLDKLVETAREGVASSVVAADENGRVQPLCAIYLRAPALAA
ncbi:MAG: molybdenum cofactor guanylyltransferase, partial [Acidimicrobiia bacterium]